MQWSTYALGHWKHDRLFSKRFLSSNEWKRFALILSMYKYRHVNCIDSSAAAHVSQNRYERSSPPRAFPIVIPNNRSVLTCAQGTCSRRGLFCSSLFSAILFGRSAKVISKLELAIGVRQNRCCLDDLLIVSIATDQTDGYHQYLRSLKIYGYRYEVSIRGNKRPRREWIRSVRIDVFYFLDLWSWRAMERWWTKDRSSSRESSSLQRWSEENHSRNQCVQCHLYPRPGVCAE